MDKDVLILAIESSCDETAAAVVKNGRDVLSNIIYSQKTYRENQSGYYRSFGRGKSDTG